MGIESSLLIGLLAGLFGSTHCMAMCGGINAMLHSQIRPGQAGFAIASAFQLGRGLSYLSLGLMLAGLGKLPSWWLPEGSGGVMRWLLGGLVIVIGLAVLGQGRWSEAMTRFAEPVSRRVTPVLGRLLPVKHAGQALLAGLLWGLIPCGLLYAVLAAALLQANTPGAISLLVAFWLGTLPALVLGGMAAFRLRLSLSHRALRRTAGVAMMLTGALVAAGPSLAAQFHHSGLQWLVDCVAY